MRRCAIHQPNFFPWLGYFDKINRCDIFIFLDDVQNIKTGSSWVNRVKLNSFGKEKWFTCPIKRPSGLQTINHLEFLDLSWKDHFLDVLKNYYKKYPNFKKAFDMICEIISQDDSLSIDHFNRRVIHRLSNYFGYETQFILKSDLNINSKSTSMLIDVCKAVGADVYLCGGGAAGYQEDELFEKNSIKLEYQNFQPKSYGKPDQFMPGLSVVDYLMSVE